MPGSVQNPRPGEAKLVMKFDAHSGDKMEIEKYVSLDQFKRITEIVFEKKET